MVEGNPHRIQLGRARRDSRPVVAILDWLPPLLRHLYGEILLELTSTTWIRYISGYAWVKNEMVWPSAVHTS
jgi:hypothetical protein